MGRLKETATTVWRAVLDFVYPPHCLLCRTPLPEGRIGLCKACWAELRLIEGPRCPRCGCPAQTDQATCRNCVEKAFEFSRMRALAPFNPPVQRLVHMLKYQGRSLVGRILGEALGEALKREALAAEGPEIVPVPLHGSRRRERGYNQSAIIAHAVGGVLGLPVQEGVLQRTRPTKTQTALDLPGRMANVKGVFRVRRAGAILGRPVLLVDDVITTGATVNACTDALLGAGAADVSVAAIASPYLV